MISTRCPPWQAADVTDRAQIDAMVAATRARFGVVHMLARPREIGAAAVYLASDGADLVTGQVLAVDGGMQLA